MNRPDKKRNKLSIIFYLIFLLYLVFQILPLPIEFLRIFSPEKYKIISKLNIDTSYSSISFVLSNSFFQILNFTTLLIIIFIIKMLLYTERHINRFYLFLSWAFLTKSAGLPDITSAGTVSISVFFRNEDFSFNQSIHSGCIPCCYRCVLWYYPRSFSHV